MTSKLRNLALSAAAVFLFAFSASAQVSALEGTVKGDDGQPIKGAVVKIERKDIKGNYPVKTDKKGHYGHYGLPLGTYKVSVEVDGQVRDSVDNVRTKLGDPTPIDFNLQNQKKEQQAMAKAAETGTLTKEQTQKMTPEQRAAIEKASKAREADIAKNKALNDAYSAGKDALAAKQYDVAVDNFNKANEMDPKQNVIWAQLAEAYMGQAASKTGAEQDAPRQKGLDAYAKAIELKPDDPALYNNYALALVKAKKVNEAQDALNKAASFDPPGAVRYYYNLGAVLVNANQNDAAAEAFKKAIAAYDQTKATGAPPADITKNYAEANYQLGITMLSKANTDAKTGKVTPVAGTEEAFNRYLELQPTGQFADAAKGMLQTIGGTVATNYKNPDAAAASKKKPVKK
ncbi:MAG: carboxypeptidase regulatory-like domain-containing protein [Acidobacteriota bacterium]|nr:carboxypeptidase regulatory-like domain-containing protein [Acidobacteriota bacterium]